MIAVRVHVDSQLCAVSGLCVLLAPGVFDQSDVDGTVRLLDDAAGIRDARSAQAVRAAVARCPSGAITTVEDEADRDRHYPTTE